MNDQPAEQLKLRNTDDFGREFERLSLLTVIVLLLSPLAVWYLFIPLVILCVIGVVHRKLLTSTPYWYTITTMLGATIYLNWESVDNHKYLICYWCLTLCCVNSLAPKDRKRALEKSSRLLIGLCMAFATFWKLASDNYLDGSFFEYQLLVDSRFDHAASALGNISTEALADNRYLVELLTNGYRRGLELTNIQLQSTPEVHRLGWLLTWWTIVIEGALAALFLFPDRPTSAFLRNITLILFAVTTYSVATVKGFGWVLMLLGMAQCHKTERFYYWAYFVSFLLIQAYLIPYGDILNLLANGSAEPTIP